MTELCNHLLAEWGDVMKIKDPTECMNFIKKNFSGGDIFYILYREDHFIGSVAIDRTNFYPCLSTLFVRAEDRGRGFAKLMIDFSAAYIQSVLKFREMRLWCKPELIPFYLKEGFKKEDKTVSEISEISEISENQVMIKKW